MLWTQPHPSAYSTDNLFVFNSHSDNHNSINNAFSNSNITALNGSCSTNASLSSTPTPSSTISMLNMISARPSEPIAIPLNSNASTNNLCQLSNLISPVNDNIYQSNFMLPPSNTSLSNATDSKMLPVTFYDTLLMQQQQQQQPHSRQFIQPPASAMPLSATTNTVNSSSYNSAFLTALSRRENQRIHQQQQQMLQYTNHPILQTNTKPGRSEPMPPNNIVTTNSTITHTIPTHYAVSNVTTMLDDNNSSIVKGTKNETDRREEGVKTSSSQSIPFLVSSISSSSSTSSTSITARRKQRKKTALATLNASSSSSEDKDDTEKRKNFLERNRQAALKCRQRKKQWLQSLQERVEFLANDNEQLHLQATVMRDEVLALRNLLMAHKDCQFSEATKLAIMNAANTTSTNNATATSAVTDGKSAGFETDNSVDSTTSGWIVADTTAVLINTPVAENLMIPITNDYNITLQ
ncbi:hypothetical protein BDF20DRAFT_915978 [Mycotypha africana]|uniref:uncharacterized protein n=1 Tax=Mycotypha africana TaxID=64632 RepID=UPI00230195C7|nr:uncharacterized protein BDF20DRAFT_915978 [Mycotypha africana]KAI8970121.1 hypothetical protein BDF20DRAFT_915978 [Mycotypha africana]